MNYPFNEIKKVYEVHTAWILSQALENPKKWYASYLLDWQSFMSPIEKEMWHVIRFFGHLPMYPQFPINKYFVDFGNPHFKIAIECDGKEFHSDKEREKSREDIIISEGWEIFRVSGSDCKRIPTDEPNQGDGKLNEEMIDWLEEYYLNSIEGLLRALSVKYIDFLKKSDHDDRYYFELELTEQCLSKRRVANT